MEKPIHVFSQGFMGCLFIYFKDFKFWNSDGLAGSGKDSRGSHRPFPLMDELYLTGQNENTGSGSIYATSEGSLQEVELKETLTKRKCTCMSTDLERETSFQRHHLSSLKCSSSSNLHNKACYTIHHRTYIKWKG